MILFDEIFDSFNEYIPLPSDTSQNTTDRVREVIEEFRTYGVKLNPSCRLEQYGRQFDQDLTFDDLTDQVNCWSYLEAMQFSLIARALPNLSTKKVVLPKLQIAMGGSMHPARDSSDTKARSEQFELYTLSVLSLSGFEVEIDEPDIWVNVKGDRIPIAVKRPRSVKKIFKLIRNGSNQLTACGTQGIVALDLSFVEDFSKPALFQSFHQQQVMSKLLLDGFAHEHDEKLMEQLYRSSDLIGYLLHLSVCVTSMDPLANMVSRRWLGIGKRPHNGLQQIISKLQLQMSR